MRWLFLDRIERIDVDDRAVATATFETDGDIERVHFPWRPIVPGVLQLEVVAQLAAKLILESRVRSEQSWSYPILTLMQDVKFRRFLAFDEPVRVEVELRAHGGDTATVRGRVRTPDGPVSASCEQLFRLFADPPGVEGGDPSAVLRVERDELTRLWPGFDPAPWNRALARLTGSE